jgi:hypothetical protein
VRTILPKHIRYKVTMRFRLHLHKCLAAQEKGVLTTFSKLRSFVCGWRPTAQIKQSTSSITPSVVVTFIILSDRFSTDLTCNYRPQSHLITISYCSDFRQNLSARLFQYSHLYTQLHGCVFLVVKPRFRTVTTAKNIETCVFLCRVIGPLSIASVNASLMV